jgi:glycosyltransferase involved in cell wall biosynthesis
MPSSVHAARWIRHLRGTEFDVHLFPCRAEGSHPLLAGVKVHFGSLLVRGSLFLMEKLAAYARRRGGGRCGVPSCFKRSLWLAWTIRRLKPDIVHSLEFQHAGYLATEAKKRLGSRMPPWVATNWGSDIYLFGRLRSHAERIKELLAACDYYSCECERDVILARQFGFSGRVLPVLPNAGGLDIREEVALRARERASTRKLIAIKGYQHWAGRALTALRAVELCADALRDYRIVVFSAGPDVEIAVELLAQSTGLAVEVVPHSSHEDMLALFAQARAFVGLSISDGISTSMLEAMTLGAFPIQSCTACADEWLTDGVTGIIVPPEDAKAVADAIRVAASNDKLVDEAQIANAQVAASRLNPERIREQVLATYREIITTGK